MGNLLKVDTAAFNRAVKRESDKIRKENQEIDRRTLNELAKKATKIIAEDIQERTGLTQRAVRNAIKIKKATRRVLQVVLTITGRRLQYPKLREIKRKGKTIGVSYQNMDKQPMKQIGSFDGHSGLFIIPGKYSDKKVAVFRESGEKRKTTTFAGHSVPFLVRRGLKTWLIDRIKKIAKEERERQTKKVSYLRTRK